jgi:hypothetical protein
MLYSDLSPKTLINDFPFIIIIETKYMHPSRQYSTIHLATTFDEAYNFANNFKLHNFYKYKIILKNNSHETEKTNLCWNIVFCDNKDTTNTCIIRKAELNDIKYLFEYKHNYTPSQNDYTIYNISLTYCDTTKNIISISTCRVIVQDSVLSRLSLADILYPIPNNMTSYQEKIKNKENFILFNNELDDNNKYYYRIYFYYKYQIDTQNLIMSKLLELNEEMFNLSKQKMDIYKEELIQKSWHPSRLINWCIDYDEYNELI